MSGGSGTGTPVVTPTGDAYISVATADTYFANQLNVGDWDAASSGDKTKALIMATNNIDQLNFIGEKADDDQDFEFPRWDDTAIPQAIQDACAECALGFIKGVDPDMEYEAMMLLTESVGPMRTTRNQNRVSVHMVNGIPSIQAWRLLQPYLHDNKTLVLDKIP